MKKPPSFGRFLLTMVFLLEGLSLAIVISFLFAMLDGSMKQEMVSRLNVQHAELRLYLSDRLKYTYSRTEEIHSNNNIKIALFLGLHSKIAENVQDLYPETAGSTFYIRSTDGQYFPPLKEHQGFLRNAELSSTRTDDVIQMPINTHTYAYFAPIVQQDQIRGHAVGIYDLSADPNFLRLLKALKNLSLSCKINQTWTDFLTHQVPPGQSPKITEVLTLSQQNLASDSVEALRMGMQEFPSLFLIIDNKQYLQQRWSLITKLVLLCIPPFLLTCTFSFLILKRVTSVLHAMSKNALHIAETDSNSNLDTTNIRHAEFLYLTKAFNKVLSKMRRQTVDLTSANETLQQQVEERQRMAKALQESESQLRSLQDNIPIGLYRRSIDGRILFVNPEMVSIFGFSSEQEMMQEDVRRLYYNPQQHDRIMEKLETSDGISDLEIRLKRKDGTLIWGTAHLRKTSDPKTGAVFIDGAILDITDRKKIEEENHQLESQLRQTHKMEALGTLAGGIAHDFNNILFAIIGFCELALEDAEADSVQYCNIQEAIICVQRAAELVRQILTFARQTDVEKHPLSLISILKENLKLLRATLPTTVDIRTNLSGEQSVLADPTQIHQIIVNLCTNAAHAMRETGGILTIELDKIENNPGETPFEPRLKEGVYARLRVKDTGHGMPPKIIERIFDPYFTTKPQGEGTGMGLSVVQGIISRLNGVICVDSDPGKGTTFDVYLPSLEVLEPPPHAHMSSIVNGKEQILFIDDEPYITRMVSKMLSNLGYQITSHNCPVKALKEFRSSPDRFDLIISDVTMPRMAGYDLAGEIIKIRPDLPILLCTGYNDSINEETASRLGVRGLLHKPLTRQDLSSAIRSALDCRPAA